MLFFQLERKETNQTLAGKIMKLPSTALRFLTAKKAEVRDTFQWGFERDVILHFLKVEVLLPIYQNQNNTIVKMVPKMVLKA